MKSPSSAGLRSSSPRASASKRRNCSVDTLHEIALRQALWRLGLRFRKNMAEIPGRPDIVFTKVRVVVFCDGDFWHGRNWRSLACQLRKRANANYWCQKIRSNMLRDRCTTQLLEKEGWRVVRFWEGEILDDPTGVADRVKRIVLDQRKSTSKSSFN